MGVQFFTGQADRGHQILHGVDPPDGDDSKGPQMRADHQRPSVVVADDAGPLAAFELGQIGFELGAEVVVLYAVNRTPDIVQILHRPAAAARTQMEVIIGAVEKIVHTVRRRRCAEQTAHGTFLDDVLILIPT